MNPFSSPDAVPREAVVLSVGSGKDVNKLALRELVLATVARATASHWLVVDADAQWAQFVWDAASFRGVRSRVRFIESEPKDVPKRAVVRLSALLEGPRVALHIVGGSPRTMDVPQAVRRRLAFGVTGGTTRSFAFDAPELAWETRFAAVLRDRLGDEGPPGDGGLGGDDGGPRPSGPYELPSEAFEDIRWPKLRELHFGSRMWDPHGARDLDALWLVEGRQGPVSYHRGRESILIIGEEDFEEGLRRGDLFMHVLMDQWREAPTITAPFFDNCPDWPTDESLRRQAADAIHRARELLDADVTQVPARRWLTHARWCVRTLAFARSAWHGRLDARPRELAAWCGGADALLLIRGDIGACGLRQARSSLRRCIEFAPPALTHDPSSAEAPA